MYSKNMYAFFIFFIILCFAPLIRAGGSELLSVDYYDKTCPRLHNMVLWAVWNATQFDPRMPASLLRMHFHDCFVNGCDGSVLLDDTSTKQGEKSALPNKNSIRGFEVIDDIKTDVERFCKAKTVSCADILTLAARASVKLSLPKFAGSAYWDVLSNPWEVRLGRLDGLVPNVSGAISDITSPFDPVDTLISKFFAKGLSTQDMVVLSGAHTIGKAKCSTFKSSRLYPADKSMDPKLLRTLQNRCPNNNLSNEVTVDLDGPSPTKFDNSYYNDIGNKAGILKTDQDLGSDTRTSKLVKMYAKDELKFLDDFGVSMEKMSITDVITAGGGVGGRKGRIRKKCGSPN